VSLHQPSQRPLEAGSGHDIRPQRMAELVADRLRHRILTGDLEDGDLLPKEEELRELYPVSKPSFREAMRILEAQGLITIRRGNVGGAVVHRPTAKNVAYTLAMVLATREATMEDVAQALRECEPLCVALCAERSDRRRGVLPTLRRIQKDSLRNVPDLVVATMLSRQFHEALVLSCGNESLIIMVGALEAVWSSHETNWASRVSDSLAVPLDERRAAFDVHEEIIQLIDAGDSDGARELSANHLKVAQGYPTMDVEGPVDHSRLR
jgi:GntR family transcriptional regulator, transcriptional repressor for pyruvate dehydrogenase complex